MTSFYQKLISNFLDGTITASALHYTAEHAFTPEFGYRPDVKNRYVIFITDGMTSDEEVAELPAAIDELNKVVEKVKKCCRLC